MTRQALALLMAGLLAAAPAAADRDGDGGSAERGRAEFERYCASCHGPEGRGDGPVGRTLSPPMAPLSADSYRIDADGDGRAGSRADLETVLVNGAPAYGGSRLMAPFPQLAEQPERLADLLAFLDQRDGP